MTEPEYPKCMVTYDFEDDNHASIIQLSAEFPNESDLATLVARYHLTTPELITNLKVMPI